MDYKIVMRKNFPSGVYGKPTLYAGQVYEVPEKVSDKVAKKAVHARAAEMVEKAKPKPEPKTETAKTEDETPKRTYTSRKSLTGAPENKSAAPADKSTLD